MLDRFSSLDDNSGDRILVSMPDARPLEVADARLATSDWHATHHHERTRSERDDDEEEGSGDYFEDGIVPLDEGPEGTKSTGGIEDGLEDATIYEAQILHSAPSLKERSGAGPRGGDGGGDEEGPELTARDNTLTTLAESGVRGNRALLVEASSDGVDAGEDVVDDVDVGEDDTNDAMGTFDEDFDMDADGDVAEELDMEDVDIEDLDVEDVEVEDIGRRFRCCRCRHRR